MKNSFFQCYFPVFFLCSVFTVLLSVMSSLYSLVCKKEHEPYNYSTNGLTRYWNLNFWLKINNSKPLQESKLQKFLSSDTKSPQKMLTGKQKDFVRTEKGLEKRENLTVLTSVLVHRDCQGSKPHVPLCLLSSLSHPDKFLEEVLFVSSSGRKFSFMQLDLSQEI